jgi:tetratricopeptide (TPR) repeat protein
MQQQKISIPTLIALLATTTTAFTPIVSLALSAPEVLAQTAANRKSEADRLYGQANQQYITSQFQAALQSYRQALTVYQEIGDRFGQASSLGAIGTTYWYLGQFQRSVEFCERSLVIARDIKARQPETYALGCLGWSYASLNRYPQAIEFYQQQLTIAQILRNRSTEANALRGLGQVYNSQGEYQKALERHQQSLEIVRTLGNRQEEAKLLGELGWSYQSLRQYQPAIDFYQQSLIIQRVVGDRFHEGITLTRIGTLLAAQNQPELAIIFYKQSVKVREDIRQGLRELPQAQQEAFVQTVAYTYNNLAVLLRQQGRDLEAQRVRDLLNVQASAVPREALQQLPPERQIWKGYEVILNKAIELQKELTQLESTLPPSRRTPTQRQRIVELRRNEQQISQQCLDFLESPEVIALVKELKQVPDSFRFTL